MICRNCKNNISKQFPVCPVCGLQREENLKYLPARLALVNVVRSNAYLVLVILAFAVSTLHVYKLTNVLSDFSLDSFSLIFDIFYAIFGYIAAAAMLKIRKSAFTGNGINLPFDKLKGYHNTSKAAIIVLIVLVSIVIFVGVVIMALSSSIPSPNLLESDFVTELYISLFSDSEASLNVLVFMYESGNIVLWIGGAVAAFGAVSLTLLIIMLVRVGKIIAIIKNLKTAWAEAVPMTVGFSGAIVLSFGIGIINLLSSFTAIVTAGSAATMASDVVVSIAMIVEAVIFIKLSKETRKLASQANEIIDLKSIQSEQKNTVNQAN